MWCGVGGRYDGMWWVVVEWSKVEYSGVGVGVDLSGTEWSEVACVLVVPKIELGDRLFG